MTLLWAFMNLVFDMRSGFVFNIFLHLPPSEMPQASFTCDEACSFQLYFARRDLRRSIVICSRRKSARRLFMLR